MTTISEFKLNPNPEKKLLRKSTFNKESSNINRDTKKHGSIKTPKLIKLNPRTTTNKLNILNIEDFVLPPIDRFKK
jgi:hypothetical protein